MVELSATLPTLRPTDSEWIDTDFRTRWKNKGLCYYVIAERKASWQVLRWYYKSRKRKFEVMQIWLDGESEVVLSRKRFMRYDGWVTDSPMTPKCIGAFASYSYLGDIRYCPCSMFRVRSLLPTLRRAGLRTSLHGLYSPYALVTSLLTKPRVETLWKLKQYQLVNYYYYYNPLTDNEWASLRVALRHGYNFTSYKMIMEWHDTLHMMARCGADTHNPQLICPADLKEAHDMWNKRYYHVCELERLAREIKDAEAYEPFYQATREQFADMVLTDGQLIVKVIPTAKGIIEEGHAMHHCVGGYYNRPNSLILSATIDGKRIETVEVNLATYKIVQCHGLQNKSTKYHKRIRELVKANLDLIRVLDMNHKDIEKRKINKLKKAV